MNEFTLQPSPANNHLAAGDKSLLSLTVVLYLVTFFLHFVWEMWQVPLYVGMAEADHWSAVLQCTLATIGDGFIALIAYSISAFIARDKYWLHKGSVSTWAVFIISGLAITVLLEVFATNVYGRWQYSELMPIVPVINVGLSPLLQWLMIPPITIWISAVVLRGLSRDEQSRS
jgi:hypothetical protein